VSVRTEVLLWARRVLAKKGAAPHELLDLDAGAGLDAAQAAFHKIARIAHPDLHRTQLTPEELELVTTAYSRVAGAYQELRSQRVLTARTKSIRQEPLTPRTTTGGGLAKPALGSTPGDGTMAEGSTPSSSSSSSGPVSSAMSSKALVYYRKAELALRRGDLRGAVLQLKMAIAADPASPFLRTALTEVEAEVSKKP
jgi:hypothetical protein